MDWEFLKGLRRDANPVSAEPQKPTTDLSRPFPVEGEGKPQASLSPVGSLALSFPPTKVEEKQLNLSNYNTIGGGVTPDDLLENILKQTPDLSPVLEKGVPLEQRIAAMKLLDRRDYNRLVIILITISFSLGRVGQFQLALDYDLLRLETIRAIPEDAEDAILGNTQPRNMADAYESVAQSYLDMGEISLALQAALQADIYFDKDEALRDRLGIKVQSDFDRISLEDHPRALLCGFIANLYRQLGDHQLADRYTENAWKYSLEKKTGVAQYNRNMSYGNGAFERGDFEAALGYYRKALDLALKNRQATVTSKDVAKACVTIGDVYAEMRLSRKAMEYYQRALDLNKKMNNHGRIITNLERIGDLHRKMVRAAEAIGSYQEAVTYASIPTKELVRKANQPLAEGLPVFQNANGEFLVVQADPAWQILHKMGQIESERDPGSAVPYFELAIRLTEELRAGVMEEEHRINYQESIIEVYESMIELQYTLYQSTGSPDYLDTMFIAIERAKSRVLTEQLAGLPVARPANVSAELLDQEEKLVGMVEQIERKLLGGQGDPVALAGTLNSIKVELDQVWYRIAQENPREGAQYTSLRRAEPITSQLARQYISQGGKRVCAVEYYLTKRHLFILLLFSGSDEIACVARNISRETIRELTLVNPQSPPSTDLRMQYWQLDLAPLLIEPIAGFLQDIDLLIFVPHDVLHSLPLHALYMSQQDQRGCIQIPNLSLVYISSLSLVKYVRSKPARNHKKNLVMGNPLREDQPAIEHTEQEAVSVAAALEVEPYLGKDATLRVFTERAEQAEYIHLACHGQFSRENALSSALLLTGGDLQARDIFNMHLGAELVVLSACETGISLNRVGDELIGFVRSLLYAGTPSVILSLWNAYDKSTAQLMTIFYENIILKKMPKAKALAEAQRSLIEMGIGEIQWAPFILIGDWE